MLDDARSHGLWEKTAPAAPVTQALSGDHTADVVVVGGGYTGLSTALHLAEAGSKVILLEAKEIGFGGAGRNVGLINAGMWVMPDDLPGELGDVHGERLLTLLGNGPREVIGLIEKHGIACELETAGTLHCAVGDAGVREVEARAEQWQRRGAAVEVLGADQTRQKIGTSAYKASLLDHRAGTLQPLAYVRGLAHAAIGAGVAVHTATPVTGAERQGRKWKVTFKTGSVLADWLVVATDAYSDGPWENVRREQVALPYFNLATKPLTKEQLSKILPGREGCWDTREVLSSFRMDHAGRLVFGSVGALRGTGLPVHRSWARRALKSLFPELGKVEFEAEWYGRIGMTDNALPRLHRYGPAAVGFCGYNGRGIVPGTVFGRVLAEHVLGKAPEEDLPLPVTEVAEPTFRPLKEAWYEAGAQLFHLVDSRL